MRKLLEQAIVHLLNDDKDKAADLFHKFVVGTSRNINESLRKKIDEDTTGGAPQWNAMTDSDVDYADNRSSSTDGDAGAAGATLGEDELDGDVDVDSEFSGDDVHDLSTEEKMSDLKAQLDKIVAEFSDVFDTEFGGDVDGDVDADLDGDVEDVDGDDFGDNFEDDDFEVDEDTTPVTAADGGQTPGSSYGNGMSAGGETDGSSNPGYSGSDDTGGGSTYQGEDGGDVTEDHDTSQVYTMGGFSGYGTKDGSCSSGPGTGSGSSGPGTGQSSSSDGNDGESGDDTDGHSTLNVNEADDESFDDIAESIAKELNKISVKLVGGKEVGNGKSFTQNNKSNLPTKKASTDDAKPVSIKQSKNDSFTRETPPSVKDMKKNRNTKKPPVQVSKEGDKSADLNKDFAGKKK